MDRPDTRGTPCLLSTIDLNLLLVLHTVLEERSVVRAAARLCVTPSAVSNALRRARAALGDALLVRGGKRLIPTSWALEIQPALALAVRSFESALRVHRPFDPGTVERRWTIGASDYAEALLLPPLMAALRECAPGGSIRVIPVESAVRDHALQLGNASLLIGRFPAAHEGCRVTELWTDEAVSIARLGHPHVHGRFTAEAVAASADDLLAPLVVFSTVHAMWHERTEDDPAEAFLRAKVLEIARHRVATSAAEPLRAAG